MVSSDGIGTTKKSALAGLRVVDFSWAASGPLCTLYLALHGAEVIKIESAKSLDLARRGYYTAVEDIDASPNFNDMNLNKLSVRLNLKTPQGITLVKKLIARSDLVIENFRPGVMANLGLTYPLLRSVKPDIVMVSASTGGQEGPERTMPGYATVFGALGGLSYLTGYQNGPSTEIWDSIDMRLGTAIALAATIALYRQRRTGKGQHIDLSSREVISSLVGHVFLDTAMNGRIQGRRGNQDDIMAPHNAYACVGRDRWISIAVATDDEWQALCTVAKQEDWASDSRFSDRYGRWLHQTELDDLISEWTRNHDVSELATQLQAAGVPATASMDTRDLATSPHIQEREVFWRIPHPKLGVTRPTRTPWLLSDTPASPERHAPMFGEHTKYIFHDILGLADSKVAQLVRDGILD